MHCSANFVLQKFAELFRDAILLKTRVCPKSWRTPSTSFFAILSAALTFVSVVPPFPPLSPPPEKEKRRIWWYRSKKASSNIVSRIGFLANFQFRSRFHSKFSSSSRLDTVHLVCRMRLDLLSCLTRPQSPRREAFSLPSTTFFA